MSFRDDGSDNGALDQALEAVIIAIIFYHYYYYH